MSTEPTSLAVRLETNKFRLLHSFDVRVTQIYMPSTFYVRPVCVTQNDLNALEVCGRPLKKRELKINSLAVYYSEYLGKFVRGKICKVIPQEKKTRCTMQAIDYGCYDFNVPLQHLYKSGGDASIGPLATLCQMARCFPISGTPWDEDAGEAMKNFIGKSIVKIYVQLMPDNRLIVDANIKATMADVGQWLISNHFAVSYYPDEYEAPHPSSCYKEYTYSILEECDVASVRVQSALSIEEFYVAKLEDYDRYLVFREEFTRYCVGQEDILPPEVIEGRAVGYKCPFKKIMYERAYIMEVLNNGEKAIIQLIDWGDKIEVNHTELKMLDYMKIRDTPAIAVLCSSTETADWEYNLHEHLVPGFECVIHVKSEGEDFVLPTLVDITRT